ncbi:hypothetical protein [Halobellus litoreus]|uniref:Uracil DNA glycosylase superfamily protein n=1 Tax=Halobellus litoreus TaxID=755310 RepID=A0ABD6E4G3_9EURY|nr:hypothetical protein [Halobellus litoreus]
MTVKPPSGWLAWRWTYLDWFAQADVRGATEYLELFGGTDKSAESIREEAREAMTLTALEQMGVHGFERPTIANNQEIAIVGINPHLSFDIATGLPTETPFQTDNFDSNFRFGLNPIDEPESDLVDAAGAGLNWLLPNKSSNSGRDGYVLSILVTLAEEGWIDIEKEDITGLSPREDATLSNQIYYTNWFKYATPGEGDLKSGLDKLMSRTSAEKSPREVVDGCLPRGYLDQSKTQNIIPNTVLGRELAEIDPDLILSFGNLPKERFFRRKDASIEPLLNSPDASEGITSVHAHPYAYTGPEGIEATVIPLTFPGNRSWRAFGSKHTDPVQESEDRLLRALDSMKN